MPFSRRDGRLDHRLLKSTQSGLAAFALLPATARHLNQE
jgi:hypothetical protein